MKYLLLSAILFAGILAGCSSDSNTTGDTTGTTTGTTGTTASTDKATCAECGKEFAKTELIAHGTAMICKSCDAAHGH